MTPVFEAIPSDLATAFRAGRSDANGQPPEAAVSDGGGNPCRHCLRDISGGAPMLLFAYRPFPDLQPYAETGPVFLCAGSCVRFDGPGLPPVLASRPRHLVKPYTAAHRIAAPGGAIVETPSLIPHCRDLLARPGIAYIHIRSAVNNCYLARVLREDDDGGRGRT